MLSPEQKRSAARAQRRHLANERKRFAAQRRAEMQERRDEAIAPAAQRLPVIGRDGKTILRGPRVERNGVTFIRSNVIKRLVAMSSNKEAPLLVKKHADAAERLLVAWETAGAGVTYGVAHYGPKMSGTSQTGVVADSVLHNIGKQVAARKELDAVRAILGGRWGAIYSTVIVGLTPTAWGEEQGMNSATSCGYLAACLDTLADYYAPERPSRIRAAEISAPGERDAAD